MNIQEMSNVAKQILILFRFMDREIVKKIPRELLEHLKRLEIDANIKFKYEENKSLEQQDLLEETKDLLAVIFYSYIADEKEKEEILNNWNINENKYSELMLKEYSPQFAEVIQDNNVKEETSLVIDSNKGTLYQKIKSIINRLFKR